MIINIYMKIKVHVSGVKMRYVSSMYVTDFWNNVVFLSDEKF